MESGSKFSTKFRVKWVQFRSEINFNLMKEGQHIVNKIPNTDIFANKNNTVGILETLRGLLKDGKLQSDLSVDDFYGETYKFSNVADVIKFLRCKNEGKWVIKKLDSKAGKGVMLTEKIGGFKSKVLAQDDDDWESVNDAFVRALARESVEVAEEDKEPEITEADTGVPTAANINMSLVLEKLKNYVVQKYYEDIQLIDGKKFDIRSFMIIVSVKPFIVLYNPGYSRLCLDNHSYAAFGKKQSKFAHLTINSYQKKHAQYADRK